MNVVGVDGVLLPSKKEIEGWNCSQLLEWLAAQKFPQLQENDFEMLRKARILGILFLLQDKILYQDCGIPLGTSVWLQLLAKQISSQERGTKRTLEDDYKETESRPFKLFRTLSSQYTDLVDALNGVSTNLEDYCDPAVSQMLPFPFVGEVPGTRFVLSPDGRSSNFYGREKFREVYSAVKSMSFRHTRMYFVCGTLGAGKPHLLAALTCLLMKEGRIVVYLPDFRALLRNIFDYLRCALRLAFNGHAERAKFLDKSTTLSELEAFFEAAASEFRLLFVIDQSNALDPEDEIADRFSLVAKREARTPLDKITAEHLKLASASGNYQHVLHDTYRQTGEKRLHLYWGLTDTEMECWWPKNAKSLSTSLDNPLSPDIALQGILDDTSEGQIMNEVLVQLSSSQQATDMMARVKQFAQKREEEWHSSTKLLEFRKALHPCISGDSVSAESQNLLVTDSTSNHTIRCTKR